MQHRSNTGRSGSPLRPGGRAVIAAVAVLAVTGSVTVAVAQPGPPSAAAVAHAHRRAAPVARSVPVDGPRAGGRLQVVVRDGHGAAIRGAHVRAVSVASGRRTAGTTGRTGTSALRLAALPTSRADDRYSVTVDAPGFFTRTVTSRVASAHHRTVHVVLDPSGGAVAGTISGGPADLVLTSEATGARVRTRTAGAYSLIAPALPSPHATTRYRLEVRAAGYTPVRQELTVAPGTTVRHDVRLAAAATPHAATVRPAALPAVQPVPAPSCPATGASVWTDDSLDGSWETPTNWAPAGVPAASATVCIPAGDGPVEIDGAESVAQLFVGDGATLTLGTGRSLVLTGAATSVLRGTVTVPAGSAFVVGHDATLVNAAHGQLVDGADRVAHGTQGVGISGTFVQQTGTITQNPIALQNGSTLNLDGAGAGSFVAYDPDTSTIGVALTGDVAASQSLDVPSVDICHGGGATTVTAAASFTNAGVITFDHVGPCHASNTNLVLGTSTAPATLTNAGTLAVPGEDAANTVQSISGNVVNTGTVSIGSATTRAHVVYSGGTLTNSGPVSVAAQSWFTVASDSTLANVTGGSLTSAADDIAADGVSVDGFGVKVFGAFTQGAGTVATGAGTYPVYLQDGAALHLTGSGAGAFTVFDEIHSTVAVSLTGDIAADQTLDVPAIDICHGAGTTTLTAAASFTNAGHLVLDHVGSCSGSTSTLQTTGTLTNAGSLILAGQAAGQQTQGVSGNIVNTGTIEVGGAATATSVTYSGGMLHNQGQLTVRAQSLLLVGADATVSNDAGGAIATAADSVSAGTTGLVVSGTFVQAAGTIATDPDHRPVYLRNGSTLHLAGTGAGSFTTYDPNTSTVAVTLGGDLAANQVFELAAVDICHGAGTTTVNAASGFTNAGHLVIDHIGTCGGSGVVLHSGGTVTNTGSVSVVGAPNNANTQTVDAGLVNTGTLSFGTASAPAHVVLTAGHTFTNNGPVTVGASSIVLFSGADTSTTPTTAATQVVNAAGGSITSAARAIDPNQSRTGVGVLVAGTFTQGAGTVPGAPVYLQNGSNMVFGGTGAGTFTAFDNAGDAATVNVSGNVAGGQTFDVDGVDTCHGGTGVSAIAASSFSNTGTIELTHVGSCGYGPIGLTLPSNATLTNHGTLRIGSGSRATITGSLAEGDDATLTEQVVGAPVGAALTVTGTAQLGGTLDYDTSSTFTPTVGAHYPVLADTVQTGSFAQVTGLSAGGGLGYSTGLGADGLTGMTATVVDFSSFPSISRISPTAGPAGTEVTIYGTDLGATSAVRFGSKTAVPSAASSSQLTVAAPDGSGSPAVAVVTPDGTTTAVGAPHFTYASEPSGGSTQTTLTAHVRDSAGRPLPNVLVGLVDAATRNPAGVIRTDATGSGTAAGLFVGQTLQLTVGSSQPPYGPTSKTLTLQAGGNDVTLSLAIEPLVSTDPTALDPVGDALAVWPAVLPQPGTTIAGGALAGDRTLADVRFTLDYTAGQTVPISADPAGTQPFCVDGSWTVLVRGPAPATTERTLSGHGCPATGAPVDLATLGLATGTYGVDVVAVASAGATTYGTTDIYALPTAGTVHDLRAAPGTVDAPAQFTGSTSLVVGGAGNLAVRLGGLPLAGASGYHGIFGFDPQGIAVTGYTSAAGYSGGTRDNFANGDGGFIESTSGTPVQVGGTVLTLAVSCRQAGDWPISFTGNYWLPSYSNGYSLAFQGTATVHCTAPAASATAVPLGVSLDPATGNVTVGVNGAGLSAATTATLRSAAGAVVSTATSVAQTGGTLVTATFPPTAPGRYDLVVSNGGADLLATSGTPYLVSPALPLFAAGQVDVEQNLPGIATTHIWRIANHGTLNGTGVYAFTFPSYLQADPTLDAASMPPGTKLLEHGRSAAGTWIDYVAVPVAAGGSVNLAWTTLVPPCAVFGSQLPNCSSDTPAAPGTPIPMVVTPAGQYTAPQWAAQSSAPVMTIVDGAVAAGTNTWMQAFRAVFALPTAARSAYLTAVPNGQVAGALLTMGADMLQGLANANLQATGGQRTVAPPSNVELAPAPASTALQGSDALGDPTASSFANYGYNTTIAIGARYGVDNPGPSADGRTPGLTPSAAGHSTHVGAYAGAATTYAGGSVAPVALIPDSGGTYHDHPLAGLAATWRAGDNGVDTGAWTSGVTSTMSFGSGAGGGTAAALPSLVVAGGNTQVADLVQTTTPRGGLTAAATRGRHPADAGSVSAVQNAYGPQNSVGDTLSTVSNALPSFDGLVVSTGFALLAIAFGASFPLAVGLTVGGEVLGGLVQMMVQFAYSQNVQDVVVHDHRSNTSEDPNDIGVAPAGAGTARYVTPQPLTYTIRFENEKTATAAARDIVVHATLDPHLDPATVQPGDSSFTGTQFAFDPVTRQLTWTLPKIDLAPNTAPPVGEGFVTFTAAPLAGAASGTTISEQATVLFDFNPPLQTPTITTTIDTAPPTTSVAAIPATVPAGTVPVTFTSTSPVGIDHYLVYVKDGAGPLRPVDQTTTGSTTLAAVSGHTYGVAVQAVDRAGLAGVVPTVVQRTFTVARPASRTTLRLTPASAYYGHEQAVLATVAVTSAAGVPAGTVAVRHGSATLCTVRLVDGAGRCALPPRTLAAGREAISALYAGSASIAPSTSPGAVLTVLAAPTSSVLVVAHASITYGKESSERFTVTVRPAYAGPATGTVTVRAGRTVLCSAAVRAGHAVCALSAKKLRVGRYAITATYAGSAGYRASTSAARTVTVTH